MLRDHAGHLTQPRSVQQCAIVMHEKRRASYSLGSGQSWPARALSSYYRARLILFVAPSGQYSSTHIGMNEGSTMKWAWACFSNQWMRVEQFFLTEVYIIFCKDLSNCWHAKYNADEWNWHVRGSARNNSENCEATQGIHIHLSKP